MRNLLKACCIALVLAWSGAARAQTGNGFDASWKSVTGGAGRAVGNGWTLDGIAGQAISKSTSNGVWSIQSGFWNRVSGNLSPRAVVAGFSRGPQVPLKIRITDLLTNALDPDGELLRLDKISAISTNGASLSTNGTYIFYVPASTNDNTADAFSYTVRDGYRGVATATVIVNVVVSNGPTFNIVSLTTLEDGNTRISFAGIPGHTYVVQAATNLSPPITWLTLASNTVGSNGIWTFDDLQATNYPARYYRTAVP